MNKLCVKEFAKIFLFVVIFLICFINIFGVLNYKNGGRGQGLGLDRIYSAETKHDFVVIGSSHAGCNINTEIMWEDYGIAGSILWTGTQKLDATFHYLKEIKRTHNPKVVAIELYGATFEGIQNAEENIYWNSLPMKWSRNFWEYTNSMADNMDMSDTLRKQLLLKVPVVHNRYAELEEKDFADTIPFLKGYRRNYECTAFEQQSEAEGLEPLHPDCEQMLIQILEYAQKEQIQLLLFAAPFIATDLEKKRLNTVEKMAEEYGVAYIDYNHLYEELGLDFSRDIRDVEHLNDIGGDKFTKHFFDFVLSNFDLEDRRGQEGYESWGDNALWLRNSDLRHDLEQAQDINEYLQMISEIEDEQTVILALTGNYKAQGDVYLEKLMQLGISREDYERGGVFILRNKAIELYLPGKEYKQCIKTKHGEIHLESSCFTDETGYEKDEVQLIVDSKDYRMIENGVNIIVYNERLGKVVDAAGVDIYLGLELVHKELLLE